MRWNTFCSNCRALLLKTFGILFIYPLLFDLANSVATQEGNKNICVNVDGYFESKQRSQ